jgi:hypothetical protein
MGITLIELSGKDGGGELLFDHGIDNGIIFFDHELEWSPGISNDLRNLPNGQVPNIGDNSWEFSFNGGNGAGGGIDLGWNGETEEFTFGGELWAFWGFDFSITLDFSGDGLLPSISGAEGSVGVGAIFGGEVNMFGLSAGASLSMQLGLHTDLENGLYLGGQVGYSASLPGLGSFDGELNFGHRFPKAIDDLIDSLQSGGIPTSRNESDGFLDDNIGAASFSAELDNLFASGQAPDYSSADNPSASDAGQNIFNGTPLAGNGGAGSSGGNSGGGGGNNGNGGSNANYGSGNQGYGGYGGSGNGNGNGNSNYGGGNGNSNYGGGNGNGNYGGGNGNSNYGGGNGNNFGGGNQGYGGNSNSYGGNSNNFGGGNQGYGGNSNSYGGNGNSYGGNSTNNGNNPGNPNAPGYYGGNSNSYGGNSNTYGGNSNSTNNGNNPGNPNAPGYYGGNSNSGYGLYSPVLLDLDGNGVKISEFQNSTQFMTGEDGLSHRTSWAGAGDGVLFYDAGNDNQITEEREYVFTEWNPTAAGDLEALRSVWDTNGDGKLTAADAEFAKFKVMVTNADGSTSVQTLAALGITEINLTANTVNIELPDGSVITGQTTFKRANGTTGTVANTTLTADAAGYRVTEVVSTDVGGVQGDLGHQPLGCGVLAALR